MASFKFAIGRPFAGTGLPQSYTGDFLSPTSLTTFTTGSTYCALASGYSVADGNNEHLLRTVRWTYVNSSTNAVYSFNLQGGASAPVGIFVENLNVTSINIRRGSNSTSINGTSTNYVVSKNPITGRHQVFAEGFTGSGTTIQVELMANSRVDTTQNYLELGRVSVWHTTTPPAALSQNFSSPYSVMVSRMGSQRYLPGGITESTDLSQPYSVIELTGQFDRSLQGSNVSDLLNRLQRTQPTERVLFYENRGNTSRAFMTHLNTDVQLIEQNWPLQECNIGLREVL